MGQFPVCRPLVRKPARVEPDHSLLCDEQKIEYGIPKQPFYANDLAPAAYARAKDICKAAGVKDEALLDACMLDTTVLNNKLAARVFTGAARPVATMKPVRRDP